MKLSNSYLKAIFILICRASSGKGFQSLIIQCVKRHCFPFAFDLLLHHFVKNTYPLIWEILNNHSLFHPFHYFVDLYYNPTSSHLLCAALGLCLEKRLPVQAKRLPPAAPSIWHQHPGDSVWVIPWPCFFFQYRCSLLVLALFPFISIKSIFKSSDEYSCIQAVSISFFDSGQGNDACSKKKTTDQTNKKTQLANQTKVQE